MATEHLAHREWLGYVQPVGLVVSIPALLAAQAHVNRHIAPDHQRFLVCLRRDKNDDPIPELHDLAAFTQTVLGWEPTDLTPFPEVAPLPDDLAPLEVVLPEYHDTLRPTYVVREFAPTAGRSPWHMLVQCHPPGTDLDAPLATSDRHWHASPQARCERLLRETGVPIGLLVNGTHLRLVYAPRGESSGSMTFAVAEMAQVAGRPIFAGLHLLLAAERLFSLPEPQRFPPSWQTAASIRTPCPPSLPSRCWRRCMSCCVASRRLMTSATGRCCGTCWPTTRNKSTLDS